jgi:hypothetical protein
MSAPKKFAPTQFAPKCFVLTRLTPLAAAAALAALAAGTAAADPGVAAKTVNLRQGPGTNYPIIGKIPAGSAVDISACQGQWCTIAWHGQTGYAIAASFYQSDNSGAGVQPPPGAPPPGQGGPPPPGAGGPPPGQGGPPYGPGGPPPQGATADAPIPASPPGAPPPGYPPPPPGYYPPPPGYYPPPPGYYDPYYPNGYYGYGYRRRYW